MYLIGFSYLSLELFAARAFTFHDDRDPQYTTPRRARLARMRSLPEVRRDKVSSLASLCLAFMCIEPTPIMSFYLLQHASHDPVRLAG